MNKNKLTNYIIIGAVLIVLIFVIYRNVSKNKINNENPEANNQSITEEMADTSDELKDTPNSASVAKSNDKEKFNSLIKLAQQSLIKKDYAKSMDYYNQALVYEKSDIVYSGMFNVYSAQSNWNKALEVLDKAIEFNPGYTDYWAWKIQILDEKTGASFQELNAIYQKGYEASFDRTKLNLITFFANIADRNGEKIEAIGLWNKAITLNPDMKSVYQAEIDRLNKY